MFKRDINRKTKDSDDNSKQSSNNKSTNESKTDNTSNNQSNTDSTNNTNNTDNNTNSTNSDSSTPSGNSDHSSLAIDSGTPNSSSSGESDHSPDHPSQEGTDKNYSTPPTPESNPSYNNTSNTSNTNTAEPKTIEKPSSSNSGESASCEPSREASSETTGESPDNNIKGYSSNSSNSSNSGTISREQINLDEQKDLVLSTQQEIIAELINDINSIEGKSDSSFTRPSSLAEEEAVSYQRYLEDIKDNNIYIVPSKNFKDFPNFTNKTESTEFKPTFEVDNASLSYPSADTIPFRSSDEETDQDSSPAENVEVIAVDLGEKNESGSFDFTDYYKRSDYADFFESDGSSESTLTQQIVSNQQQEQLEIVSLEDDTVSASVDSSEVEPLNSDFIQAVNEEDLAENPKIYHGVPEGNVNPSIDLQSDSSQISDSPILSENEMENEQPEFLEEKTLNQSSQFSVASDAIQENQEIQKIQNIQDTQNNQSKLNLSSLPDIQTKPLSEFIITSSLRTETHTTDSEQKFTESTIELSNDNLHTFPSENLCCVSSSLFSSQKIIQTELLSESFILDSYLESSKQPHVEEESSVISDTSPTSIHSFDKISLDSPRLFTHSYEQLLQDTEQIHLIDLDNEHEFPLELSSFSDLSSLTSLATLGDQPESVELISHKPALPDPPPYDFRADLEQQEEWEASHSPSIRNQLLRRLQQARIQQETASYHFALERGQILNAQLDKSSHESENTEKATISPRTDQNTDSTFDDGEVSGSADINPGPQAQSVHPQQSRTSSDSRLRQELRSDPGIFTQLSSLTSNDRLKSVSALLDNGLQSSTQKEELAEAILEDNWNKVNSLLSSFLSLAKIEFDSEILQEITDSFDRELVVDQNPNWLEATIYNPNQLRRNFRVETTIKFQTNTTGIRSLDRISTSHSFTQVFMNNYDPQILLTTLDVWQQCESPSNQPINPPLKSTVIKPELSDYSDLAIKGIDYQRPKETDHFLTVKHGLFTHIAQHVPILNNVGTKDFLNHLMQSMEQKQEVLHHLINRDWNEFYTTLRKLAVQKDVTVDPEIFSEIITILREQLHIRVFINIEGRTSATLTSNFGITNIIYRSTSHSFESLKNIKTKSDQELKIINTNFDRWSFLDYKIWYRLFYNKDALILEEMTKSYDSELFIREDEFEKGIENSPRTNYIEEKHFINSIKTILDGGSKLYSKIEDQNPCKIKIIINNWTNSTVIKDSIKIPIREDTFTMKNEKFVDEIFRHSGVIEKILTMLGGYEKGDLIISRRQVLISDLRAIPKNYSLDSITHGVPDNKKRRRPDIVTVIRTIRNNQPEVGTVFIDQKKTEKDFNHRDRSGRGRGQPLRDSRGFIIKIDKMFPDLGLEKQKVTSMVTTAEKNGSTILIKVEVHFHQEEASKVLPYSGRICFNNNQFRRLLEKIKKEE